MVLHSKDSITRKFNLKGITSWSEALSYIQHLPYGRNSDRTDPTLVLKEGRGTCSSKHALLKLLAERNGIPGVQLFLGMYKMNGRNTPPTKNILAQAKLAYIPEAHCYLKINGQPTDLTFPDSDFTKIENDLMDEWEIRTEQTGEYKVAFHRGFLTEWAAGAEISRPFDEVWKIREACIHSLSR